MTRLFSRLAYAYEGKNIDTPLIIMVSSAILFGLLLLYSANHFSASLPLKQLAKGSLILVFIGGLSLASDRQIRDWAIPLYILSLILLLWVLFNGYMTKGAQRWINLFFFRFEPSELVKITLPLALASHIHRHGIPIRGGSLIAGLCMIAIPFFLVLKQPDLGTASIILMIGGITLFIAGLSRRFILTCIIGSLLLAPVFWHQLHSYQQQRIITLFSPGEDKQNHGYHIHQSKIAIGSGGAYGKGFGKGTQSQLGYIPEHKTDFIFSLLSEELGFWGNIVWLCLVLSIGFRCMYLGHKQSSCFNKLCCISLGCNFMLNAWINMSMVSGMLPVVGIPLPLISYGGTSFVVTLLGFALILKLGHTDPRRQHLW